MRLLSLAALALSGCFEGAYLAQQGVGQLRLLRARRRVSEVLADPSVGSEKKARLRLAMEARRFGIEVLGLRGGDAYTRFLDTGGAPVAWNVTAAPPDRLVPHVYKFPIVGRIPYLGFFREADARAEARKLSRRGFDVYLRGVAGYSTLGFTSDPIYSSMLEGGDARIVEVILHEMLHGTLYVKGRSEFNESLATFVGVRGAALFLAQRGGAAAGAQVVEEAARRERDQARFAAFLEPVLAELKALYALPLERAEKMARRDPIFRRAQARYLEVFPTPPGRRPPAFVTEPLNNAILVAHAVYHRDTPLHQRLYERLGRDLAALVALYKEAVEGHADPVRYLERL